MGKYIIVNGKRVYIKDGDLQDDGKGPEDEEEEAAGSDDEEEEESGDAAVDAEAEKAARAIGKALRKELGLDEIKAALKKANDQVEAPENSKLRELLHGKDLMRDKDKLTAEEKIIGFFHGLVTRNDAVCRALAEGVNADGGFLFPAEFLAELIRPLAELPRARALVRVVTMRRNVLNAPSLLNRPKVYWTAENAAKTTTTASFGQATLTARKAAAILYASDELIEDSTEIDVVRLIIDLFAEAIGEEEDRVILRGNGTTEPTGLITAVTAATIPGTASVGNLSFDNVLDLEYGLKSKYRKGASFLVHPNNVKELRKLKDSNNRYLWEDSRIVGQPATLHSYPVHEFYDMPEATILFGNWKLCYWLGDRKQMTVKISQDTTQAFTQDETAIRVVIRLGGNVVLGEAAHALTSIP